MSYEAVNASSICKASKTEIDIQYTYFKRIGKVVIVYVTIGLGAAPGAWKDKTVWTMTNSKWKPKVEGVALVVRSQTNGLSFDCNIDKNGTLIIRQRNATMASNDWFTGMCVYIVN